MYKATKTSNFHSLLKDDSLSKEQLSTCIISWGLTLSPKEKIDYRKDLIEALQLSNIEESEENLKEAVYHETMDLFEDLQSQKLYLLAKVVLMPEESSLDQKEHEETLYADPFELLKKITAIIQNFQSLVEKKSWKQAAQIGQKLLALTIPARMEVERHQVNEISLTLSQMANDGLVSVDPILLQLQTANALFQALDTKESVEIIYEILKDLSSPLYRLYTYAKPEAGKFVSFLLSAREWLNGQPDLDQELKEQRLKEIETLLSFLFPKGVVCSAISEHSSKEDKLYQFSLARILQNADQNAMIEFLVDQYKKQQDRDRYEEFICRGLKSSKSKIQSTNLTKILKDYQQVQEDLEVFENHKVSIECRAKPSLTLDEMEEMFDFCYISSPANPEYFRYFTYVGDNKVFGRLKRDLRFLKQAYKEELYPLVCEIGLRLLKLKFDFLNLDDFLDDEQEELEFWELFSRNLLEMERDEFDFLVSGSLYLSAFEDHRKELFDQFASLFEYHSINLPNFLETGKRTLEEFKEFLLQCMEQDPKNSQRTWGAFEQDLDINRIIDEVLAEHKALEEGDKGHK